MNVETKELCWKVPILWLGIFCNCSGKSPLPVQAVLASANLAFACGATVINVLYLLPGTVSSLELPADLGHGGRGACDAVKKKRRRRRCFPVLWMLAFVPFTINIRLSRTQVTGIPGKLWSLEFCFALFSEVRNCIEQGTKNLHFS